MVCMYQLLLNTAVTVWKQNRIPQDCRKAIICLLCKKTGSRVYGVVPEHYSVI